jgi:hypothetical protein
VTYHPNFTWFIPCSVTQLLQTSTSSLPQTQDRFHRCVFTPCTTMIRHTTVCKCKVKVQFTLEQTTKAQREVEVRLYTFFNLGTRWGGWSTPRPGRFTPGKETRYPLHRTMGGPQGRSGRVPNISPPPGLDPRTVQHVPCRYTDWAIPAHTTPYILGHNIITLGLYSTTEFLMMELHGSKHV